MSFKDGKILYINSEYSGLMKPAIRIETVKLVKRWTIQETVLGGYFAIYRTIQFCIPASLIQKIIKFNRLNISLETFF